MIKLLLISAMYPSEDAPVLGVFIKRQIQALENIGVSVVLIKVVGFEPRRKIINKYSKLGLQVLKSAMKTFDVIHVHYPTLPGVYGGLVALMRRKPLVVTLHGGDIDEIRYKELNVLKQWGTKAFVDWSLRQASAIIAVGPELAKLAVNRGVPPHKISVIDMGVDCHMFRTRCKEEARGQLGLSSDNPLILFVGALIPIKGPEYFIRAASLLKKQYPECRWCLVGEGSLDSSLRILAKELGVKDQVIFAGRRPPEEVALWDAAADALVMPSLSEGFGLAALEAMACGTPVVASEVGGLRSFVKEGENGFLIPPASADMIAHRVNLLLSTPGLGIKMGQNGIETARQHDLRLQAQRVLQVYEKVLYQNQKTG